MDKYVVVANCAPKFVHACVLHDALPIQNLRDASEVINNDVEDSYGSIVVHYFGAIVRNTCEILVVITTTPGIAGTSPSRWISGFNELRHRNGFTMFNLRWAEREEKNRPDLKPSAENY